MMKRGLAQDAFKRQRIRFGLALLAIAVVGTLLSVAGAYNSCRTQARSAGAPEWDSTWSWWPPGVQCSFPAPAP